jgi:hypothetical protein
MVMTVSNVDNSTVKGAVVNALENVTGVPSKYMDTDVVADQGKRRLRTIQLAQNENWKVTYVISVPGDAPVSVDVTGLEVGGRLKSASPGTIEHLISSNVAKSEGSRNFTLSVQRVSEPDVVVRPSSASNPVEESGAKMKSLAAFLISMCAVLLLLPPSV